ncbi:hypothetical protein LUZ60_014053 [Juncus effusus]|nr:hypothetical protein LUZ60_014053 [Juncus effusus]
MTMRYWWKLIIMLLSFYEDITILFTFSSKSAYDWLVNPGINCAWQNAVWKVKAPPKVRYFLCLTCDNRINTADNLRKKGWPHHDVCVFCKATLETRDHLFINCPFVRTTRRIAQRSQHTNMRQPFDSNFVDFWMKTRKGLSKTNRARWEASWAAITWNVWKERNNRLFNDKSSTPYIIARKANEEATLWLEHC